MMLAKGTEYRTLSGAMLVARREETKGMERHAGETVALLRQSLETQKGRIKESFKRSRHIS